MPTITLGKVKFIHRGAYNASTVYSKGDIVDFDNRMYIFQNDTPKNHSPIFLNTINGTVPSLGIQTNKIRMDFSGFNPVTQKWGLVTSHQRYSGADGTMPGVYSESGEEWAPPTGLMVYSEYFDPYVGITSVNVVDSNTADLYLNQVGINTSTISNASFTLGPRRMCGMYEHSVNWLDWDILSEGYNPVGEWNDDTVYLPGDIVQKNNSSYICGVGHSDVDPIFDYPGVWRMFSQGDDLQPHQRVMGFTNKQPWKWKGHPWVDLPQWGTNNRWNGNIPWNTSLGIGSTSPHAWRWNAGNNEGHMSYRKSNQFLVGSGQLVAEGGTPNDYYTQGYSTTHTMVREADISNAMNAKNGMQPDIGNLPRHRTDHDPTIIQAYHSWNSMRANLHSNGTLTMSGTYGNGYLGYHNDFGTDQGINIHKAMFKGRSIVKVVSGGHQARDGDSHIIALDEYGEIHTWGRNDTGQCGISSDRNGGFRDSSPDIHYFSSGGMSVNNRTYLVHSMNKDLFFAGRKIVDIWAGHRWSLVMDEVGELWSWGYNTRGNLGYPTNSGFGDSDRSYQPQKINVNWNSYGGIQKVVVACSEANVDSLYVLDGQGHIWSQGYNGYGQLGTNNTSTGNNSSSLGRRTSLNSAGSIVNFWADACNSYGHLWWRNTSGNNYGVGYDGHYNITGDSSSPGTNSGLNNITYMPSNSSNQSLKNCVAMCASGRSGGITQYFLTDKGHVYATGWNGYGESGCGHSSTVTNNQIRYQQNGQRQYALGRQLHCSFYSAGGSNAADNTSTSSTFSKGPGNAAFASGGATCIDIWGTGDYDGSSSHTPWSMTLFDNGELTGRGRNYDWGAAINMGHIWGSIHHHGAG